MSQTKTKDQKEASPQKVSQFLNQGWKEHPASFNQRDLCLYAVGIGCQDMRYVYEKDDNFSVFPTYPFVLGFKGDEQDVCDFPSKTMGALNVSPPLKGIRTGLDGERYLEVINPLPATGGEFILKNRLLGVQGKKTGALVEQETIITDKSGKEYIKMIGGAFMVGAKNVESAGESGSETIVPPKRAPDAVVEYQTNATQALVYRLSGDYNPLHVDPNVSKMMNFKAPILHGLCTLGHAARAVLETFADNDASRFKAIKLRFASPVIPGDTLVTSMWKEGDRVFLETKVKETGAVVINNAFVDLRKPVSKL